MIDRRHAAVFFLAAAILGCVRPTAPQPRLPSIQSIAVFPPNNRTGDILLVAGASVLEKYVLKTDRITVPDVLASEARVQLVRYGFTVAATETVDAVTGGRETESAEQAVAIAAGHQLGGAVLYVEIKRWEADASFHPSHVIAVLDAALVDVETGRTLWRSPHLSHPLATPGVVTLGDAYVVAARKAMEELLMSLGRETAPS